MTAAPAPERPLVRRDQRWMYQGQRWRVHDVLVEGVIVLMGPAQYRGLQGVTADELYSCGVLEEDAPQLTRAQQIHADIERAQKSEIKPRRARPKPSPAPKPWRCVLLAIDTAANSGWSLWVDGELVGYGEVRKDDDRALLALCKRARAYEADDDSRLAVLLLEAAAGFVYRGRGAAVLVGLGAAREAWRRAWRDAGGRAARVVSVKPTRWRGELFGRGMRGFVGQSRKTADIEARWARVTLTRCGLPVPANDNDNGIGKGKGKSNELGPDACAAVCIGCWGVLSGEVGNALPAKQRRFA